MTMEVGAAALTRRGPILDRSQLVAIAAQVKRRGLMDLTLRYNPLVRRRAFRLMDAFDRADGPERERLAGLLTRRIIERARGTPYGRGRSDRYETWPVLDGTEVRDSPGRFTATGLVRIPAATGGTRGQPLRLWRSASSVAAEQAFLDRIIEAHGLTWRTARIASLRGDTIKSTTDRAPPFGVESHRGRRLVLSSPHLSTATLEWFLDRLASFRPDILWIWPSMAANLLLLARRARRAFGVPIVLASSERLEPELREAMEREWGASVLDYYGQAERACFAVSERAGEFWFVPAYGRVELATAPTDEVVQGGRHVAILATGYWNSATPLIRYDTGDRAIVPAEATPDDLRAIELGIKPFLAIAGRSDEFLLSRDGVRICGLNQLPREVERLLQIQIVQPRRDEVVIRALVQDGFGPADRARLEANARAKIPSDMRIRFELVDRLETSQYGKTPFVIRRQDQSAKILDPVA